MTSLCAFAYRLTSLYALANQSTNLCALTNKFNCLCAQLVNYLTSMCALMNHLMGMCALTYHLASLCVLMNHLEGMCALAYHLASLCVLMNYLEGMCALANHLNSLCAPLVNHLINLSIILIPLNLWYISGFFVSINAFPQCLILIESTHTKQNNFNIYYDWHSKQFTSTKYVYYKTEIVKSFSQIFFQVLIYDTIL